MSRQHDAHESYAVAAGKLHWSAAVLAGSLLAVLLGMVALYQWLQPPTPVPMASLPPAPRLQPDPAADLAVERARQQARLQGYAWVDRDAGIARIPIGRAMALLVERERAGRSAH
jgi:hypothetical protein